MISHFDSCIKSEVETFILFVKKNRNMIFVFALVDYVWTVELKVESEGQKSQSTIQYTLSENDENHFPQALVEENNPRCLQHFLLKSKKPAVRKLKLQNAKLLPDRKLSLTLGTQKKISTLLQQCDVETCVYQCLKENNCRDILLFTEKGYRKLFY